MRSLGDVARLTEPDMALVTCFKPIDAPCPIKRCCLLRDVLKRARSAFTQVLDGYSLADLVWPRGRLQSMLAIAPARNASGASHAP
jgi:Rrf2 family nitric oxide-sensitive transcriptional repressor